MPLIGHYGLAFICGDQWPLSAHHRQWLNNGKGGERCGHLSDHRAGNQEFLAWLAEHPWIAQRSMTWIVPSVARRATEVL